MNVRPLDRDDFDGLRAFFAKIPESDRTFFKDDVLDPVTTPELSLDFGRDVTFNVVRLREYLPLGQRIEAIALERWSNGQWLEFARATSIGSCRLVRTDPITTSKVRLRVTQAPVCPALSELAIFLEAK